VTSNAVCKAVRMLVMGGYKVVCAFNFEGF
jgi:hypothetical protein